jgi:hypothetical protein
MSSLNLVTSRRKPFLAGVLPPKLEKDARTGQTGSPSRVPGSRERDQISRTSTATGAEDAWRMSDVSQSRHSDCHTCKLLICVG